jgi:hypothetical protein
MRIDAKPVKRDINDIAREEGLGSVRERQDRAVKARRSPTTNGGAEVEASEPLLKTSAEFVADFTPPDYLIDGVIMKSFVYAMTAPTGGGKTSIAMRFTAHVANGLPLGDRNVAQGKVLFFAGENPDDVRMRWILLCEEMGTDSNTDSVFWCAGSLKLSDKELRRRIDAETAEHGPFALIVVDTSAAFFEGDDENSNAQMGAHARMFRSLVSISGAPAVLVTCHPKKNADPDWLIPRGGGAFVNEVDTNLVCVKQPDSGIIELYWHVKIRGPDFTPIPFKLASGTTDRLKDSKGRLIWTVTARPITEREHDAADIAARRNRDALIAVMVANPGASLRELTRAVGWKTANNEGNMMLVRRTMEGLKKAGLAEKSGDRWTLTKGGTKAGTTAGSAQRELALTEGEQPPF